MINEDDKKLLNKYCDEIKVAVKENAAKEQKKYLQVLWR